MAYAATRRVPDRRTILVADNNKEFLRQQGEAFASEGFDVVTTSELAEAERLLESPEIDVAVLDMRLTDDDDAKDVSGLQLAKSVAPGVPKIIVTCFPTSTTIREALIPDGVSRSIIDYVDKEHGTEAIIAAVRKALAFPAFRRAEVARGGAVSAEVAPLMQTTRHARIALAFLLLALGAGVAAVVTEDPRWLFGTIGLTVLTVFLIGTSNR